MDVSSSTTSSSQSPPNTGHGVEHELLASRGPQEREERADLLRKKLRKRILDSRIYRKPLNVLLVGLAGVGKSSFVNSVTRAITKEYGQWMATGSSAGQGRGNISSSFHSLNAYDPGIDDPERLTAEEMSEDSDDSDDASSLGDEKTRRRSMKDEARIRRLAPKFFDVAGIPNENSTITREILRLLMYGHVPLGENLLEMRKMVTDAPTRAEGIAILRRKYRIGNPNLVVDRVVVVHAAGAEGSHEELLQAIMETAQPLTPEQDGVISRRTIPQFGLLTKTDLIHKMSEEEIHKFERKRSNFLQGLALGGNANRFKEVQNYFVEFGADPEDYANDPAIDIKLLDFMFVLCDRTITCDHPTFKLQLEETPELLPQSQPQPPLQPSSQPPPQPPPQHHHFDQFTVGLIILALSVYIGVLLHYGVFSSMIGTMGPAGVLPSAALILTPLLFLVYIIVYHGR